MPKSLPTVKFAIVDIPEVSGLDVQFVYNFFVPDESVNDSGVLSIDTLKNKTAVDYKQSLVDSANFNRFVPRYNHITWSPRTEGISGDLPNVSIINNLDKIYNETSFAFEQFSSVQFQDTNIRVRSKFFLDRLLEEFNENTEDISLMDLAKIVNENTPNNISSDVIIQGLDSTETNGQHFIDTETGKTIQNPNIFQEAAQVGFRSQINNKILGRVLQSSATTTVSSVSRDFFKMLDNAKQIEENTIAQNPGTLLSARDYDMEIRDFISIEAIDTNGFQSQARVVGYIINKTEITPEGNIVAHKPIVVESALANSTIDLKIKYGSKYEYTIQSVALFKVQAEDALEGQVVAVSFLVSSRPSFIKVVKTNEEVPPPPPVDFKVEWDYNKSLPRLSWNFPVNTQRDIKYFQVFKRMSTTEPFQLVKMYDFDDSVQPTELTETPDLRLVERLTGPKNYYIDSKYTFDKNAKSPSVIYAVCAIDAHGLSSGYSMQFRVVFDRFKNQILKEVVSPSGAPKAYPNMFLSSDAFVDSIRDSDHKKMRIVFNPEFLKLKDSFGNDLRLIKTDEGSKYRIQMINVDLQEQKVFDIEIKDLT
jgi:hypothetical protein